MTDLQLVSGFQNPVNDSQQWYRVILNAMARPGNICLASDPVVFPCTPEFCNTVTASIMLTLLDNDTATWLQQPEPSLVQWLKFHCGCPVTEQPAEAAFAFIADGTRLPDLNEFAIGTSEYPDKSTTLIIQVASVTQGEILTLSGPGIASTATIHVSGLHASFHDAQSVNTTLFPQGFDTILAAPDGVVCIPRTTTIRRQEPCM
ncbi:phosphonate C-P lyase system protein PhnH [Halodesulfovibrio spirochaetisodalis]|uniref:Phosphonate metabolism protein PhnH n=1 Tax=Halodesulfovibrio spirochaetisodalis TaxID=1560234 RepID=A0A1B7XEV2_9BACT|nr:phosphonate C-P lyase system protein PhnH [Halodesulfovibrio spirochaetisodalis]OBQ52718.1 hypothetical protein SP90_07090 [Halodesulfovibrio spirochaetisodalis]